MERILAGASNRNFVASPEYTRAPEVSPFLRQLPQLRALLFYRLGNQNLSSLSSWGEVYSALNAIVSSSRVSGETYIWRRCNFDAERERISAASKAGDSVRMFEQLDILRNNVRRLGEEHSLALREMTYYMKVINVGGTYHTRYWSPDNPLQKSESIPDALRRDDVFTILNNGISSSTFPEHDKAVYTAFNRIIQRYITHHESQKNIAPRFVLSSLPPQGEIDSSLREGYGTHSFNSVTSYERLSTDAFAVRVSVLRTELSLRHHVHMRRRLTGFSSLGSALFAASEPVSILSRPIQVKQKFAQASPDTFIHNSFFQAFVSEKINRLEKDAVDREQAYVGRILTPKDVARINSELAPLFALYEELVLHDAPESVLIAVVSLIEKDLIMLFAHCQKERDIAAGKIVPESQYIALAQENSKRGTRNCELVTTKRKVMRKNKDGEWEEVEEEDDKEEECVINCGNKWWDKFKQTIVACGWFAKTQEGVVYHSCPNCRWYPGRKTDLDLYGIEVMSQEKKSSVFSEEKKRNSHLDAEQLLPYLRITKEPLESEVVLRQRLDRIIASDFTVMIGPVPVKVAPDYIVHEAAKLDIGSYLLIKKRVYAR